MLVLFQERWSHPALIGVVLLLQGIAGAATPWVPDVLLMGAVSGMSAFFTGAAVTGNVPLNVLGFKINVNKKAFQSNANLPLGTDVWPT